MWLNGRGIGWYGRRLRDPYKKVTFFCENKSSNHIPMRIPDERNKCLYDSQIVKNSGLGGIKQNFCQVICLWRHNLSLFLNGNVALNKSC